MTTVELRPVRSGWCSPRHPPESHARCAGAYLGHPCPCECHHVVEAEIVDGPIRLDVAERTPEWYAARRQGVTASEIPGLLGLSPEGWSSPYNLYWSKLGVSDDRDDEAMAWGRDLERVILARFAREHPELHVTPGGLHCWSGRPWQMATPDGLAYESEYSSDPVAVVQVKTAFGDEHWGDPGTDDIPTYYVAQTRWEMDVMGVSVAYVPVLFSGRQYREYVVTQDAEDIAFMRAEAQAFLDRLARRDPPEVDWRAATTWTLKALHPEIDPDAPDVEVPATWVRQWQLADRLEKAAGQRKALAQNRLLDLIGDARRATVNGRRVATRSVYDVKERTMPASTVRKLNITRKELP